MAQLEISDLTLSFGGLAALRGVSLSVERGAIYSIIGPNGAGKTCIFNCLSRIYTPQRGAIRFEGTDLLHLAPHQVARRGIARTFQNIELFSHMTTLDNLLLARHVLMRGGVFGGAFRLPWYTREEIRHREKAEEIIDFLELQSARDQLVVNLPFGTRKLVELGRALALGPKLLLLDEPSAGMNLEEKQDLLSWIKDIREEFDITVLLVEHDMNIVMDISDRVFVLNNGEKVVEGVPKEVQTHPEVLRAYLGEAESR